jgi:hypothetical protein
VRAHLDGAHLVFEDPITHRTWRIFPDEGALMIDSDDGRPPLWIRASDAASIGDWLRRTFAEYDWRIGVDPARTSIPIEVKP